MLGVHKKTYAQCIPTALTGIKYVIEIRSGTTMTTIYVLLLDGER